MKHLPALFIFCSGLLFCCFAIPCQAEILFAFDSGGGTSDMSISGTIPGSSDTVTYLTDVFHTLTIAGLPGDDGTYTGLYLPETFCATGSNECLPAETPNVIYVTGDIGALGIDDNSLSNPLVAITLSGALTGTTTSDGTFTLNYPSDVSAVYVDPNLLAALGLSATPPVTGLTNMFTGGGNGNYTVADSASLALDADAPEPNSWLLMALGILLVVLSAAGKSSVKQ